MNYQPFINKKDFYEISVPPDGACFFHAIVGIIHLNNNIKNVDGERITYQRVAERGQGEAYRLRLKVVNWLSKNKKWTVPNINMSIENEIGEEITNKYSTIPAKTVDEYLEYMKKKKAWAGQIEMYAVHKLFKRNIKTYEDSDNPTQYSAMHLGIGNTMDIMNDIYLHHSGGADRGHFQILFPKIKATIIQKSEYMKIIQTKKKKKKVKKKTIKKKILKKGMDNESKWEKNRKQMIKTIRGKKRFKRRVKFSDNVDVHIIKGGRRKKRRGK